MSQTTHAESAARGPNPPEIRMRLRYGVNEADSWWHFALGPQREHIWARLREMDTRIIRIFLFDKYAPDPVTEWSVFAAYVQAVLNVGATPMITFAKFPPPFDDPRALRRFAGRCADVVWNCIEQWGGEVVRDWYWCVWNEPNSPWVSGGLAFEQYRRIYEEAAQGILRWLAPYLEACKPLIGGPAVDGFQPFWMDWIWRFVNEIDNSLIGFASWHRYGDWREHGKWGAPQDEATYRALLMARTREYESRAQAIARLLKGREILNVCGQFNAHSHHEAHVSGPYNQSLFGATYYASALLRLLKGGADVELLRTGTDNGGPYGILDSQGRPAPAFHAKKLCAQYLRYGDRLCFPSLALPDRLEVVFSSGEDGRQSLLLVHPVDEVETFPVPEGPNSPGHGLRLLKIDRGTAGEVVEGDFYGAVTFEGYGVAVVTSQ